MKSIDKRKKKRDQRDRHEERLAQVAVTSDRERSGIIIQFLLDGKCSVDIGTNTKCICTYRDDMNMSVGQRVIIKLSKKNHEQGKIIS